MGLIYFQADIAKVVDKLVEERVIQLDVVSFGAGESDADLIARKNEAVQRVNEFITEKFFEPSLNPKAAISGKWYSELGAAAKNLVPQFSGFTRRSLERVDHKRLQLNLRERSATERRIMPQGHLQGLLEILRESPRGKLLP